LCGFTANQLTSRIDTNAFTHTYVYDANGNQTSSTSNGGNANSNRQITYTAFNKTKRLVSQPLKTTQTDL
jgi:YD repeat-containing protein